MPRETISAECVQDQCRDWLTRVKSEILSWQGKPPAHHLPVPWRKGEERQTVWDSLIEECFKRHFKADFTSKPHFSNYFQTRGDGAFQGFKVGLKENANFLDLLNTAVFLCRANFLILPIPRNDILCVPFYTAFITKGRRTGFWNMALGGFMGERSSPSSLLQMPMNRQDKTR